MLTFAEIREMLAEMIAGAGHSVSTASSGREALQQMAVERHDAILSDIRMPDLDGCALYTETERRWPGCARHVFFVTGDTLTAALAELSLPAGAR